MTSETWVTSAAISAVLPSVTEVAASRPARLPPITATSALTEPVIDAPWSRVSRRATTSPVTEPLICRSPSLTMSPSILRSLLRNDDPAAWPDLLDRSMLSPSDRSAVTLPWADLTPVNFSAVAGGRERSRHAVSLTFGTGRRPRPYEDFINRGQLD